MRWGQSLAPPHNRKMRRHPKSGFLRRMQPAPESSGYRVVGKKIEPRSHCAAKLPELPVPNTCSRFQVIKNWYWINSVRIPDYPVS